MTLKGGESCEAVRSCNTAHLSRLDITFGFKQLQMDENTVKYAGCQPEIGTVYGKWVHLLGTVFDRKWSGTEN
eukprot:1717778-Amphidinium_carterae.1